MKVVLDTNVLLVSISSKSEYYPIFSAFVREGFELCVTTDILFEYEEVIKRHMGDRVADYVLQLIENAPNVKWVTKYYKWNIIEQDVDDNKFVDCAIACNAKYLVSNDKHFNVLKAIQFPRIEVVKAKEFAKILTGL